MNSKFVDSLACNFDDNHFCNWNNEPGDDFDWGLGKNTPTLTTGPDRDHTTKKGTSFVSCYPNTVPPSVQAAFQGVVEICCT